MWHDLLLTTPKTWRIHIEVVCLALSARAFPQRKTGETEPLRLAHTHTHTRTRWCAGSVGIYGQ